MKVLMVGVDKSTKGGMWTVVRNYLNDKEFCKNTNLKYIPTSITGSIAKRLLFNLIAIIRIFFYTVFNSYDILHVHMSEKGSVYRKGIIINIAKLRKAKIIIHMHGAELEKWYITLSQKQQIKVKHIINKADKILILGNYWKEFIGSLISDNSKIEVLYNAVKVANKNNYNLLSNNLLFLGVVGKRKGIYDLIEAMKIIKQNKLCKCKLLIYGPDNTTGINDIINENAMNDYIEYKGWLDNKDKIKVLSNTGINILPSYNEGLPMTILETMAHGIPNISTNIAAIPEVLNNENGIIIEPGIPEILANKIAELINDNKARKEKSEKSYKLIKKVFSIEQHIKKVETIYKELID